MCFEYSNTRNLKKMFDHVRVYVYNISIPGGSESLSLKKWIQSDQLLMCDRYNFEF